MSSVKRLALGSFTLITALLTIVVIMKFSNPPPRLLATLSTLPFATAQYGSGKTCGSTNTNVSLDWHAPAQTKVNSLTSALNGTGIYGFIFNSSQSPPDTEYNWCNMPHTNPATYKVPDSEFKLEYVEVIHRHHKRTPYADNTFPREGYAWNCDDEGLFYGGKPLNPSGNDSADTYWSVYTSPNNPFPPEGFNGTCQFPQITRGGLVGPLVQDVLSVPHVMPQTRSLDVNLGTVLRCHPTEIAHAPILNLVQTSLLTPHRTTAINTAPT